MRCREQSGAGLPPLAERPLGTTPMRTLRARFAGTRQANRCVMHGAPDPALPACAYGGLHDSPSRPRRHSSPQCLVPNCLSSATPASPCSKGGCPVGYGPVAGHCTKCVGKVRSCRVFLRARLHRLPPARLLACFSVRDRRRSARPRMLPHAPRCPLRSSGCGVTKTRGSAPPVRRSWTTASTIAAVTPPPSRRATSGPPVVIRWCPCLLGPTNRPAGPEASHMHVAAVAMAAPPMRVPRERVAACWQSQNSTLAAIQETHLYCGPFSSLPTYDPPALCLSDLVFTRTSWCSPALSSSRAARHATLAPPSLACWNTSRNDVGCLRKIMAAPSFAQRRRPCNNCSAQLLAPGQC